MDNLPRSLDEVRQRLKATGLLDQPPTSIAGLHFLVGLKKFVEVIVADPGAYLVRFPFNLLPARWILSDTAMKAINIALMLGVTINDDKGSEGRDSSDQGSAC